MKKLIFTTILTLLGITALTSCVEEGKKGEQLTTMLTIESSQDLIDVCDIEITFKGKGGVNTIDTITETTWHRIVVNDSFPVKIGMIRLKYLVKPDFKPTKETYELLCDYTVISKGKDDPNTSYRPLMLYDVPGNKVASILDLENYLSKDYVAREGDPDYYLSSIITVTKAENHPGGEPFIFDNELPDSLLVEELPVEDLND